MEFRIPRISSESRELLREYPETLRELREGPFDSESIFFPEIGVALVPRLLICVLCVLSFLLPNKQRGKEYMGEQGYS